LCTVYFSDTLESLQALMKHRAHIAAKQGQQQWLANYQVVIAKVIGSYGDGGISPPAGRGLHPPAAAEPER